MINKIVYRPSTYGLLFIHDKLFGLRPRVHHLSHQTWAGLCVLYPQWQVVCPTVSHYLTNPLYPVSQQRVPCNHEGPVNGGFHTSSLATSEDPSSSEVHTFFCNSGYEMFGVSKATCLQSGFLNVPRIPVCAGGCWCSVFLWFN